MRPTRGAKKGAPAPRSVRGARFTTKQTAFEQIRSNKLIDTEASAAKLHDGELTIAQLIRELAKYPDNKPVGLVEIRNGAAVVMRAEG